MSWVQTYSGGVFDFSNIERNEISLTDIAWHLSQQCRYNGATTRFYSVAEHSIILASVTQPRLQLAALLHDASEAYIGDMVSPAKELFPEFQALELRIQRHIYTSFGLPPYVPPEVSELDSRLCANEKEWVMARCDRPWKQTEPVPDAEAAYERYQYYTPLALRRTFLSLAEIYAINAGVELPPQPAEEPVIDLQIDAS